MAEKAKAPVGEQGDVIIHLPETRELAASKLKAADLEKLVLDIVGGDQGSAKTAHFGNVPGVTLKSTASVARALQVSGGEQPEPSLSWSKTIWRRNCGKKK